MMKNISFAIVLIRLFCGYACAEISAEPSIEWITCESEVITIGKITDIKVTKGIYSVIYEDCTVQIDKILKGNVQEKELMFCLRTTSSKPTAKEFMNSKDGVLLFLSKSKNRGQEQHLDDMFVPKFMIDLSNLQKNVFSKEMVILKDKDRILEIVKEWSNSKIAHPLWSKVPFNSGIWEQIYAGSSCYLIVPAEEKYRDIFMKMAKSDVPHERQKAASELYKFPDAETEATLRELLKDTTENIWYSSDDSV
jgi:hypothetical protein